MRRCGRSSPSCGALTGTLEPPERKGRTPRNRSRFWAADSVRPDLPEAAHFGVPPEAEKLTRSKTSKTVYPALDGPRLSHPRGRALRRIRTLRSSGPPVRPAPSDICRRACAGRVRPLSRPGRPETAPALALLIPGRGPGRTVGWPAPSGDSRSISGVAGIRRQTSLGVHFAQRRISESRRRPRGVSRRHDCRFWLRAVGQVAASL